MTEPAIPILLAGGYREGETAERRPAVVLAARASLPVAAWSPPAATPRRLLRMQSFPVPLPRAIASDAVTEAPASERRPVVAITPPSTPAARAPCRPRRQSANRYKPPAVGAIVAGVKYGCWTALYRFGWRWRCQNESGETTWFYASKLARMAQ